jgi:hypothetical protein
VYSNARRVLPEDMTTGIEWDDKREGIIFHRVELTTLETTLSILYMRGSIVLLYFWNTVNIHSESQAAKKEAKLLITKQELSALVRLLHTFQYLLTAIITTKLIHILRLRHEKLENKDCRAVYVVGDVALWTSERWKRHI